MPYSEGSTFSPVSEGAHIFQVFEIGDDVPTAKSSYRVWKFNTEEDGKVKQLRQNFFSWDEVPMLSAMGYEKDKDGGVQWEREDVEGKRFKGLVKHREYQGKSYANIVDFKPLTEEEKADEIPF